MNTLNITILLTFVAVMRFAGVYILQIMCQTRWADKMIYPPRAGHEARRKKELLFYIYGIGIEFIIGFGLIKFSILQFHETTLLGALILLGSFMFIIEPLYYLYHRLLHTKLLFKHMHYRHHQTVVPEATSAFYFTLDERLTYTVLFLLPLLLVSYFGLLSVPLFVIYIVTFDFVNALGHVNARIFPQNYEKSFLYPFFYSPQFHGDHHKYSRVNYALYMPLWDKVFGTHRAAQKEEI